MSLSEIDMRSQMIANMVCAAYVNDQQHLGDDSSLCAIYIWACKLRSWQDQYVSAVLVQIRLAREQMYNT